MTPPSLLATVFALPFILALLLTPLIGRLALAAGFVDQPREPRHLHPRPTPKLGGAAVILPFLLTVVVAQALYPPSAQPLPDPLEPQRMMGVLSGAVLVFLVGVWDDRRELSAPPQLAAQIGAAGLAVFSGIRIDVISSPLGGAISFPPWLAVAFTVFWIVGMMNTLNWLDGLDGLAGGVTLIAALVFTAHSLELNQISVALLPLALAGAVAGFLPHNFYPARVFLGTSGSMLLGYALGTFSIFGGAKTATALLVLGIPILDVAWQILNRVQRGLSPFQADRRHIHHRLLEMGLSHRKVVGIFYLVSLVFGGLALLLPSAQYKLVALTALAGSALALLISAGRRSEG